MIHTRVGREHSPPLQPAPIQTFRRASHTSRSTRVEPLQTRQSVIFPRPAPIVLFAPVNRGTSHDGLLDRSVRVQHDQVGVGPWSYPPLSGQPEYLGGGLSGHA